MKYPFLLSAVSLLVACSSYQGNTSAIYSDTVTFFEHECPKRDSTLLDVYYGMVYDLHDYSCVLDSIPGLLKQSYNSVWKDLLTGGPDSCIYDANFTFYIDKEFPTLPVYKNISEYFADFIVGTFQDNLKGGRDANPVKVSDYISLDSIETGGDQLLNLADEMFRLANENMKANPEDNYERILPMKIAHAACRIYEDKDIATYMFSGAFDLNGSWGNTYFSKYVSIDKKSGKILGFDELVGKKNKWICKAKLITAFRKEQLLTGRFWTGREDLLLDDKHQNCCAIVKEGILFYYHTYELGCGAEGECKLIIDRF